jgi:hypothetical protein
LAIWDFFNKPAERLKFGSSQTGTMNGSVSLPLSQDAKPSVSGNLFSRIPDAECVCVNALADFSVTADCPRKIHRMSPLFLKQV